MLPSVPLASLSLEYGVTVSKMVICFQPKVCCTRFALLPPCEHENEGLVRILNTFPFNAFVCVVKGAGCPAHSRTHHMLQIMGDHPKIIEGLNLKAFSFEKVSLNIVTTIFFVLTEYGG
jgi:hypothetical protein